MKTTIHCTLGLLFWVSASVSAQTPPSKSMTRPVESASGLYLGGAIGRTQYDLGASKLPAFGASSSSASAFKLYGGYRFNDYLGLEAGYMRLGWAKRTATAAGKPVEQSVLDSAVYGAVTGRLPVTNAFSLNGRLGVARTSLSGSRTVGLPQVAGVQGGRSTGLMVGIGAQYQLSNSIAMTLDYDRFGSLPQNGRANVFSLGMRASF